MPIIRTVCVLLCIRVTTAALTPGDDWYRFMNKMAENADLPPFDHGEISEVSQSYEMGTHSTQSDVDWIQEMCLMDTNPHQGKSDHKTQASGAQNVQEASYVQSAPTPIQVLNSYHGPAHSSAHDSGPGSLDSLVVDTPLRTMVASSTSEYVTLGSENRQRKRLRDWQSTLTGLEGQNFQTKPSHLDRGILDSDHPRAQLMNQMGPTYTTARYEMHGNEGRQPKLARNGEYIPADNQGQGVHNEIINYPDYSITDFGLHAMNREIQSNSPTLPVYQYISRQASEGQQDSLSRLLQKKTQENPTEMVQILSGNDLKNHIMEILRPHSPQAQTLSENLDDIKPPSKPLKFSTHIIQKLQCSDQIKPYRDFYKDRMMKLYQNFEASTNSPVVNKIGDWDFFMVQIQQANTHPAESMGLFIPSTVKGKCYTNTELYPIFINMQQWLTKVHSVLWKEFESDVSPQADHQKMMLWFFQEIFNPQYGIPILGRAYIKNLIKAQFGPVRIWLMELLQGKQSTHTTSVAISGIWFKKTAPEQWQMRFKDDSCFWDFINALFSTRHHPVGQQLELSKLNKALQYTGNHPQKGADVWDLGIGDFRIALRRPNFLINMLPPSATAEASLRILETQKRNHDLSKLAHVLIHAKNKDLGIAITTQSQLGMDDYISIELINRATGNLLEYKSQRLSLLRLVNFLEFYSSSLILSIVKEFKYLLDQKDFLNWVHLKLFGNGTDMYLPIQGRVEQSFFNQPIIPTFDNAQIFILQNNSRTQSTKKHLIMHKYSSSKTIVEPKVQKIIMQLSSSLGTGSRLKIEKSGIKYSRPIKAFLIPCLLSIVYLPNYTQNL
ncbi:hypothetical protein PSHT_16472 [Puccinia striiformis]|uniref:Uncharacterized protein n=1 Tax=Puccinia striiformis TaxID=27350 RepID=A0A2S4U9Q2_9BASI|nr:hypothetical protein PSHT_16472 [Puccinia striiformis]